MSEDHVRFASALLKSTQFIHFCDEFFSDVSVGGDGELTNYQMLRAIMQARGEVSDSFVESPTGVKGNSDNGGGEEAKASRE
jgi:hypothetical protein